MKRARYARSRSRERRRSPSEPLPEHKVIVLAHCFLPILNASAMMLSGAAAGILGGSCALTGERDMCRATKLVRMLLRG